METNVPNAIVLVAVDRSGVTVAHEGMFIERPHLLSNHSPPTLVSIWLQTTATYSTGGGLSGRIY